MTFFKRISKFFVKAILLEEDFVYPDGVKDKIQIREIKPTIKIADNFNITVEEISKEYEDDKVLSIRLKCYGTINDNKAFYINYTIKTTKGRCFWQSDVKGQVEEYMKVGHLDCVNLEAWANERFCKHFEETRHGKYINSKDWL